MDGPRHHQDGSDEELRARIFAAAREELSRWGIDRFSVAAMADRYGLPVEAVRQRWPDDESLILEVLLRSPSQHIAIPDTGALRTDLIEVAISMAAYLRSPEGRRLLGAYVLKHDHLPAISTRRGSWQRAAESLDQIFERARQRGEVSENVDSRMALEMLFAPLNMRILFTGEPLDEPYCAALAQWLWRAATTG
jgi:AcrR family transcriptional regulator